MKDIKRVAVLGAGVMGGAIAAHFANCGIPSLMLDIVPPGLSGEDKKSRAKRNVFADKSKAALLKAKPSPLYRKGDIDLIETGNLEDDLPRIAECDWIIEVVKEEIDIKKQLFTEVAKHRAPGSIVTSNTSGIPIASMVEPMDDDMRRHFFGTHFFNPPRYMHLLEFIPGPDTDPELIEDMARFSEDVLGKGVVRAKDTTCFIGNRIMMFVAQYILHEFRDAGLSIEDVDTLTGANIGHAKSATFRTIDLVGLDIYTHVVKNIHDGCPDDEQRRYFEIPDWLQKMLESGMLGEKSGSGFYKKTDERDEKGKRVILSLDLDTFEYTPQEKTRFDCVGAARSAESLAEKLRIMHASEDAGSQFLWKMFANMAAYAGNRIPEVSDDIVNIDNAARWGFGWDIGIFETWDALGVRETCQRMEADGITPPPIAKALLDSGNETFYKVENGTRHYFDLATSSYLEVPENPNVFSIAHAKAAGAVVKENECCSLVDLGDGIVCAEFHSKMNVIDNLLLDMLKEGTDLVNEGKFDGMVVANQGEHFSAGANLFLILAEIAQENWEGVESAVRTFQDVNMMMRFCRGPVVSAPHHFTFGGGIELSQHCARVVIAGETYGGLVEAGVGVIPAGGGTKEMLRRALAYVPDGITQGDPFPYVRRAFESIGMAKVSTSGPELIDLGYFSEQDVICVNYDHQVQRAKEVCRGLVVGGHKPPRPAVLVALGDPVRATFQSAVYQMHCSGWASEHDAVIAGHLANILCGGDRPEGAKMSEQDVLDLEREAFCSLCGTEKTQDRIRHMLTTGKPLRN